MTTPRPVQSGDPVRRSPREWNALRQGLLDLQARSARTTSTLVPDRFDAHVILLENASGAHRTRGDILGLDREAPLLDPDDNLADFRTHPTARGKVPDVTKHRGRFAVVLEPIPHRANERTVGRALVTGLVVVRVEVEDEGHEWAELADEETSKLVSGEAGSAEIVWKPEGTGTLWAIVRLCGRHLHSRWVRLTAPLPYAESVEADVLQQAADGTLGTTGRTIDVHCPLLRPERQLRSETVGKAEFDFESGLWNVDRVKECDEPIPA